MTHCNLKNVDDQLTELEFEKKTKNCPACKMCQDNGGTELIGGANNDQSNLRPVPQERVNTWHCLEGLEPSRTAQRLRKDPNMTGKKVNEKISNDSLLYPTDIREASFRNRQEQMQRQPIIKQSFGNPVEEQENLEGSRTSEEHRQQNQISRLIGAHSD